MKVSFSKDFILLLLSKRTWAHIGKIKGILFNDKSEQSTYNPLGSQLHSSGQSIAIVVCTVTNHKQNITAGVPSSSDTKTSQS
jgi:hypothetical protein